MKKRLPQFAIENIADDEVVGTAESSRWIGVKHIVAIVVGDHFIWGRWRAGDQSGGRATIFIDDVAQVRALSVGAAYPFIDSYWGDRAELVLDSSRSWREAVFTPVDAVEFVRDGRRLLTKAPQGQAEGTVVPAGWDHEHCEVCSRDIGLHGQPPGWTNAEDEWVCERCYRSYVEPRSLDFINIE